MKFIKNCTAAVLLGGLLTLLPMTPASALPITKKVTIRAIQLCDDAGNNCASATTYEAAADKIWAQAGIDFVFLPTVSWNSSLFLTPNYDPNGEELQMFAAGTALFGNAAIDGILNMYFVKDLLPTNTLYGEGCGAPVFAAACNNQIGIVINSTLVDAYNGGLGRLDTVAHEVGHVLGLGHDNFGAGLSAADTVGAYNLMTSGSTRNPADTLGNIAPDGNNLDQLTQAQINEAYRSAFVTNIPEPASLGLVVIALAGIGLRRRRTALLARP